MSSALPKASDPVCRESEGQSLHDPGVAAILSVAAINALPLVGGSLGTLLQWRLQLKTQRQLTSIVARIQREMDQLWTDTTSAVDKEEFADLLLQYLPKVALETRQEKIDAYCGSLARALQPGEKCKADARLFLKTLDELSADHLAMNDFLCELHSCLGVVTGPPDSQTCFAELWLKASDKGLPSEQGVVDKLCLDLIRTGLFRHVPKRTMWPKVADDDNDYLLVQTSFGNGFTHMMWQERERRRADAEVSV